MDEQIKIKKLSVFLNTQLIISGFGGMKNAYSDLTPTTKSFGEMYSDISKVAKIVASQKDLIYYTTTQENWVECLKVIHDIVKNFKWQAEKFDCDDRAKLVSALCAILFGLNACGELYCEVTNIKTGNKSMHYANIIVNSKGEVCLFDVDNGGNKKILVEGQPISMGNWSYHLLAAVY